MPVQSMIGHIHSKLFMRCVSVLEEYLLRYRPDLMMCAKILLLI